MCLLLLYSCCFPEKATPHLRQKVLTTWLTRSRESSRKKRRKRIKERRPTRRSPRPWRRLPHVSTRSRGTGRGRRLKSRSTRRKMVQ